jgi:hypothetical protein
MNTISSSILALAVAAFATPLLAAPLTGTAANALTYSVAGPAVMAGSKDAIPMFKGGDDDSDDDSDEDSSGHGGGHDDDHDDDHGSGHGGGDDSNDDNSDDSSDDDSTESGSGRDKPRIPGGSGCDDLFDLIEHPECRI